ncbi:disintegrin and metalloproteinase domain-containing protein 8 isoform X2 [Clupea harengus]|uniref:Disintegrin and metalloproteinase domain-containing protein 8 isoform X2 n=1 Tax=Clupea harengus TaxID=7950 RepID=A0A6P3VJC5_CLUHA|nr:disintegrin and metalloproteinase domain-containing protein 8 isoform X2 [Clupea harengus]
MEYMLTVVFAISICAAFGETVRPLPHVADYEVVRPVKLSSRSKRSVPRQGGEVKRYPEKLQYELHFDGRNHTVHLEKNRLLIGKNYTETYYRQDGTPVITFPNYESQDHCYYHGHIRGLDDSSVSVGVCSGISGFLRAKQQVYLIEPLGESTEGDHAVYKPEHQSSKEVANGLANSTEADSSVIQPRAVGVFRPNGQQNKPRFKTPRYVELYLVVDNTEFRKYKTMENVRARLQHVANHINLYYRAVNISVLLVGLEVWSDKDKFFVSNDEGRTLDNFLEWRQNDLVKRVPHDNAQFVTGIDFAGETVGLATKYAMCSEKSAGVNQDHHDNPLALAGTIAHEMGHNLGMWHDEPGCSCGPLEPKCLMLDTVDKHARTYPTLFSDCSLNQLSEFLNSPALSCLLDRPGPDSLYGGAVCGNGMVDTGEECDCGSVKECKNRCCDASTCRLTAGAQCAEGRCCEDCQIKQPGSVCREADHDCDLAEYCTGASGVCPEDSFKMNGAECNYGVGYCYNGQCPSPDGHCKKLWGSGARSPPECFNLNMKGEEDGHCGRSGRAYKRCAFTDMVCGKLFCDGGRHPFVGLPAMWKGTQCHFVRDSTDYGGFSMVPNGTKCGLNKVCYDHMCQGVKVYGNQDCSAKCNNHGVCNHKGECHCDPGWEPPYCSSKLYKTTASDISVVIIGVCAAGAVILLLALLVGGVRLWKGGKAQRCFCKKKLHSGKLTPSYQRDQASDSQLTQPLHIGQPVFLETTSTRMDGPTVIMVMPSRPAPSPPKDSPRLGHNAQMRPAPPPKPSPAAPVKLAHKPTPPPVPPVKPSASNYAHKPTPPPVPRVKTTATNGGWNQTQSGTGKLALRPPTMPR